LDILFLRSISLISYQLRLDLSSYLIPPGFPTKIVYAFLPSYYTPWSAHPNNI